ncbi:6-phosphogluconolactonase [soil metagenome]
MHAHELLVHADPESLSAAAVARWVAACHHAVARRGRFVVALAGGSTPRTTYVRLAERLDLPWELVVVTGGDERHVPLDHADRHKRSARETLLAHVGVPEAHILGWGEGGSAEELAHAHARRLVDVLGDPPAFDLVLLGLGSDAHTASLFPGTGAAAARGITAVTTAPDGTRRLTLTAEALSRSEEILVLVAGADKRAALARTLRSEVDPDALPLTALVPTGRLVVLADAAAAPGSGPANGVGVEG